MSTAKPQVTVSAESDLPEGWAPTRISAVCHINPPKAPSNSLDPNEPVTFVPMPAVDADTGAITAPQERRFSEVRRGFTSFQDDDLIIAKITPCMENGKAAIARSLRNGLGFGSTEFHVLRSLGAVLPEYIYFFVRQESFRRAAEAEMTGSVGQKRVPRGFLEDFDLPLPPKDEQFRIVEQIEQLLARNNSVRERLARVPAILKRFRQAVLAAACSGRLTADWRGKAFGVPDNGLSTWKESPLRQLLREPLRNGHSARASADGRGIRTLTLSAVTYGDFSEQNTKMTIADPRKTQDLWLQPGDILIERSNTPELVGTARLYRGETRFAIFPDLLIRVRVNKDVLPEFAEFSLQTNSARDYFMRRAQGSAGTMPKIDQGVIEEFPLMIPSPKEQQEIVGRVEFLFKLADTIEKRVAAARMRAEKLTQAILAKAFRGELVPTEAELARREGRSYEPASALLARIRAERESSAGPARERVTPRSRKLTSK